MLPKGTYRDESLRTISQIDVAPGADDWFGVYGRGFWAFELDKFCNSSDAGLIARVDSSVPNEIWQGVAWDKRHVVISTSTGYVKSIDMTKM